MTDDLHNSHAHQAAAALRTLDTGLLALELNTADDPAALLDELRSAAQALVTATTAAALPTATHISQLLERVLQTSDPALTAKTTDALYDGLDVIQTLLDDDPPDEDIIAQVAARLVEIAPDTADKLRQTDSHEMPSLPDEALQTAPHDAANDELRRIFHTEATDHLRALNEGLLQIETAVNPDTDALLEEMNRVAHSLKGAARAVGFGLIETVSHYLEDIFQLAIDARLTITPRVADILYDALDVVQNALDGSPNDQSIIAQVLIQLDKLRDQHRAPADAPLPADAPVPPPDRTPEIEIPPALMTSTVETGAAPPTLLMRPPDESIRVPVNKLDQLMADASELLVARMQADRHEEHIDELRRDHARWQREWRSARAAYIRLVRRMQNDTGDLSPEMSTLFKFLEANQRYLLHANRQLAQLGQSLAQDNRQLTTLADQLQDDVANLRMMPFDTIVGGFQRMVRDLAHDLDKQVHLHINGAGVDVDKTVLDALKDPLMHLLRNAVDHGLETPAERRAAEKAASGEVALTIEQRGSELVIRVSDDGRGIDTEAIRRKAVKRGLFTPAGAAQLSDDDAQMLIFHSGLTTRSDVTSVSGRGLGMDIVRSRVESLRGRVSVESERGRGTTITLNVPVSLTRIRAIVLRVGEEDYALPSVMVERMETVSREAIFTAEGQPMLTLNERPVPLVSLAALLGVPGRTAHENTLHLVALRTAERTVAFEVDALYREMELVLKPLGRELEGATFVAGAALPGGGDVLIVLDANDLVRHALNTQRQTATPNNTYATDDTPRAVRVLVIDDSITTRTLEKNILENAGFDVHVAIDGAEAWQRLPEIAPDVIVSDVEMPHMDGLAFTRRLKTTPRWRDIPVILLTSLGKPDQETAGLAAGADAYLVKRRFDQSELLETIRQFV